MSKSAIFGCVAFAVGLTACARSSTYISKPYALADGKMYQDVVTVGADPNGSAPVVTHVKTFQINTGFKGKGTKGRSKPVAQASGKSPGLTYGVATSLASTALPAGTGLLIAKKGWARNTVTVEANSTANGGNNSATANGGTVTASGGTNNITNNTTNNNVNNNTNM